MSNQNAELITRLLRKEIKTKEKKKRIHPLIERLCEAIVIFPPEISAIVVDYICGATTLGILGWETSEFLGCASSWIVPVFNHRFYLADSHGGAVRNMQLNGILRRGCNQQVQAYTPPSPAVAIGNSLFVADAAAGFLWKFSSSGRFLSKFGGRGTESGRYEQPRGLCASDDKCTLLVCDTGNKRIQRTNLDGQTTEIIASHKLYKPISVCESRCHLYVVDEELSSVSMFDKKGRLCRRFGQDQMVEPSSVVCTSAGIVVADTRLCALLVYAHNGAYIGSAPVRDIQPYWLTVCGDYLAITGKFSIKSRFISLSSLSCL